MFDRKTIQAARVAQGVTVKELAVEVGASERQMFRYLSSVEPPLRVAVLVGRRLGLPLESVVIHDAEASDASEARGTNPNAQVAAASPCKEKATATR